MSNENNPQQKANAIMKDLSDRTTEMQREFVKEIYDAVTDQPLKKIPETVFSSLFLPFFTGEAQSTRDNPAIAHWIGLVGSGTEPAEVVDVSGNVLFTVPPMFDSSRIRTDRPKGSVSISAAFNEYVNDAPVHSGRAQNNLNKALMKKTQEIEANSQYSWEPVLRYYNLLPDEQKATAAASDKNQLSDDDLVYD